MFIELPSGVGVPDVEAGRSLVLPGELGRKVVANRDSDLDGGDDEVGTIPIHRKITLHTQKRVVWYLLPQ